MLNVELARQRREALGLTQQELGERLGVDQSAIANWELGKREPRSTLLRAWAQALGVSIDELVGEPAAEGSAR